MGKIFSGSFSVKTEQYFDKTKQKTGLYISGGRDRAFYFFASLFLLRINIKKNTWYLLGMHLILGTSPYMHFYISFNPRSDGISHEQLAFLFYQRRNRLRTLKWLVKGTVVSRWWYLGLNFFSERSVLTLLTGGHLALFNGTLQWWNAHSLTCPLC